MKYKHYPIKSAEIDCNEGMKKKYKVTTINWTFAKQDNKRTHQVNYSLVHKNEYEWTLRHLIQWIRETEDVAEDIIDITPVL